MIDIFNIYKKLPYPLKFLIFNFKAYLIHRRRYKKKKFEEIYKRVLIENNKLDNIEKIVKDLWQDFKKRFFISQKNWLNVRKSY